MRPARTSRRRRRKSRRFGGVFKLMFAVAVLAAATLGATVFFQVAEVTVTGNSRYTAQEIVDASGIGQGDNLFRIHKGRVARDVLERLPYIQEISIRRVLPDGVLLTVREWDAVAQVGTQEDAWLISVGGKLLERGARAGAFPVSGLTPLAPRAGTVLAVSQEESPRLQGLLSLLKALEERGTLGLVSAVELEDRIVLRYAQRFEVRLPLLGDHSYQLRALEAAVADREDYETGVMDLTQENYTVLYIPG